MKQSNEEQVNRIIELIETAIRLLLNRDLTMLQNDEEDNNNAIPENLRVLDRALHEVSINHRLANYIEENLNEVERERYYVDIEYNRYYNHPKVLQTADGVINARPDIIVHSRTNRHIDPQHYLVIETKKGEISNNDNLKVESFITDRRYEYMFGATISYRSDPRNVIFTLFYYNGQQVVTTRRHIPRPA